MGVHQATKNLQMNSTEDDTSIADQRYLSSPPTTEHKNPSDSVTPNTDSTNNEINSSPKNPSNTSNNPSEESSSPTIDGRTRNPKRERRPDRAVYVPRHRRFNSSPAVPSAPATGVNGSNCNSPSSNNIENDKPVSCVERRITPSAVINEATPVEQPTQVKPKRNSQLCDIELIKENSSTKCNNNISNETILFSANNINNKCNNHINNSFNNNNSNIYKTAVTTINTATTPFVKIVQKSNESLTPPIVNESNNPPPLKHHFNTPRLEPQIANEHIEDRFEEALDNFSKMSKGRKGSAKCVPQEQHNHIIGGDTKPYKPILECQSMNETNSMKSHTNNKSKKVYDKEIDDWDTLYDENGDCVDTDLGMSELTLNVVDKSPPNERSNGQQRPVENGRHSRSISTEEFPHVLEVSNFPAEFKTQDLMMLFQSYKSSGFDIKWVDDTHALAIFSSSKIAADVLSMNHPFVSLKPLPEATLASRSKARKCAELMQPYRQRPETCVALARRLVTGALGVKLKTSKEELENERRILRNAKEKRILAAKLRDEIWEDC